VIMLEPTMVRRPPMADPDETILIGVARHGAEPVAIVDATALIAACTGDSLPDAS